MKIRVGYGVKTFSVMKKIFNIWRVSFGVNRDLHERVTVSAESYGAKVWNMRMDQLLA